jgi:hypothetical protein
VEVVPQTEVFGFEGAGGVLSAVHYRHTLTGEKCARPPGTCSCSSARIRIPDG